MIPRTHLVSSIKDPAFQAFEQEYNRISELIKSSKQKIEQAIKLLPDPDDDSEV